jgi:hypothetical protein
MSREKIFRFLEQRCTLQRSQRERKVPYNLCMITVILTYLLTYLPTYLLTPWSRVLLEKLTVNFAASQEIRRIYGTRNFLTVPTRARHVSLSWATSIQSPRPPPTSWRSILILSSHLRLGLEHCYNWSKLIFVLIMVHRWYEDQVASPYGGEQILSQGI